MPERIHQNNDGHNQEELELESRYTDEELALAFERAEYYITQVAPVYAKMIGVDIVMTIGDGWATDVNTGEMTASPVFFVEREYTPDMVVYATLHEIIAHYRTVVYHQEFNAVRSEVYTETRANGFFLNIMEDIAGNRQIHAMLPYMKTVADRLYHQHLFPNTSDAEANYAEHYPRHIQMMYKMIREAMMTGTETIVRPEVDAALGRLRNFQGAGDLIDYSTHPAGEDVDTTPEERFVLWMEAIYPEYMALLEMDKKDPNFSQQAEKNAKQNSKKQKGEKGEGENAAGQGAGEAGDEDGDDEDGGAEEPDFDEFYDDYEENHHPSGKDDDKHDKSKDGRPSKAQKGNGQPGNQRGMGKNPGGDMQKKFNEQFKQRNGYDVTDIRKYHQELARLRDAIDAMRESYKQIINNRVSVIRRMSRRAYSDGLILDISRMPQILADLDAGVDDPDAFNTYESRRRENEEPGKIDYVFLLDTSSSMAGVRCEASARAAIVLMEGLAAMQRDIEAAEYDTGFDLDMDIRSAVYTFDDQTFCRKKLTEPLDEKKRIEVYKASRTTKGSTNDVAALELIDKEIPNNSERRLVVIVVTDGESNNSQKAELAIRALRARGAYVYGIGIGSDAATRLYAPNAKRVDDLSKLPGIIAEFVWCTIR